MAQIVFIGVQASRLRSLCLDKSFSNVVTRSFDTLRVVRATTGRLTKTTPEATLDAIKASGVRLIPAEWIFKSDPNYDDLNHEWLPLLVMFDDYHLEG
jgi:hypothetical protein